MKRARYIERSNEILQEFHFVHADVKMKLHSIYNSHFTGSPCWDMTSRAGEMLEATYNRNIKLTYDLPYPTHRSLLPVISQVKPLRLMLASRLLSFVEELRKSEKPVIRKMLNLVETDVRTVMGRNLRSILLLSDQTSVHQLCTEDIDKIEYYQEPELWRSLCVLEILEMRAGEADLPDGWDREEMSLLFEAACCK